jgi:hypothetical protein
VVPRVVDPNPDPHYFGKLESGSATRAVPATGSLQSPSISNPLPGKIIQWKKLTDIVNSSLPEEG